jgi:hypothetical protein
MLACTNHNVELNLEKATILRESIQ